MGFLQRRIGPVVAAAVFCLSSPAVGAADGIDVILGAGIGFAPDYEGSEDYEPVPLISAKIEKNGLYLELENFTLRANLISRPLWKAARAAGKPIWKLGPMVNYRRERDDVDNDAVDSLRKVDAAVELGGFAGLEIDRWSASIEFLRDVSDEHDGLLVTLGVGYAIANSERIRVSLGVSSTWANDDYMDSYFSIDADNAARSGLDTFSADAGFKDLGLNLNVAYRVLERWTVSGLAGYKRLLGDAKNSPIVDDEGSADQFFAGALVKFAF